MIQSTAEYLFLPRVARKAPPAAPVVPIREVPGTSDVACVLSASQLNCYLDCSAKWYYRYLLGLPDVRRANQALGSAVHAALAGNFRQKIESSHDLDTRSVLTLFADAMMAEAETIAWLDQDAEIHEVVSIGQAAITAYMADVAPTIVPAAVEVAVAGEIAGVAVRGYIDILDTQGRVIDIKTASKRPSKVRPDYRRQVATYAALEPRASGACQLHTITKTKVVDIVEQTFQIEPADKRAIETLYPAVQDGMRSGLYYPNRGSLMCSRKYCPYWERCSQDFGGEVL